MGRIAVSIMLDATPARVWSMVEILERHVDWMADAVAIRFLSESISGVGATFVCDTKVGPLRLHDVMEVTEWQHGRLIGVSHRGVVSGRGRFTLQPVATGTRFSWEEELRFPWWLGGPVGEAIGGRLILKP